MGKKRKTGLSLERHKEIGELLCRLHNELLVPLSVEVGTNYSVAGRGGRVCKDLGKMTTLLMRVRSNLEAEMLQEHRDELTKMDGNEALNIYYGWNRMVENEKDGIVVDTANMKDWLRLITK